VRAAYKQKGPESESLSGPGCGRIDWESGEVLSRHDPAVRSAALGGGSEPTTRALL